MMILLLVLLTSCGTTKVNLQTLVIVPPPGTSRTAIEAVYGKPSEVIKLTHPGTKIRVPKKDWIVVDPPRYQYTLLPKLAKLYVVYENGCAKVTRLWQYRYVGAGRPIARQGSERWQRYKKEDAHAEQQQAKDRQLVLQKYAQKLAKSPWNKKKLEQKLSPALEGQ